MPITKPRDWRENWKPKEWWPAWSLAWLVVGCAMEASAKIAARERYFAEWRRVAEHRNRLVQLLNEHEPRPDASTALVAELRQEIERLDEERIALTNEYRDRAFDEDTIDLALLREIVERGVKPYRWGQWSNLDANSAEIERTSEKKQAQERRAELLAYYKRNLAVLVDIFEDARAGAPIFAPLGEVIVDRNGNRYASRYPTPMDVAREIEKAQRAISVLTPRETRANRNR